MATLVESVLCLLPLRLFFPLVTHPKPEYPAPAVDEHDMIFDDPEVLT
jgi:hypothetical protein